jgi:hypothetical protein
MPRVTYNSVWQLTPRKFKHVDKWQGPHTIDCFASSANKQIPRYNAKWRDGTTAFGQLAPAKRGMEKEAQLVQHPLEVTRRLGRQATKLGNKCHRHLSILA